MWSLEMHFTTGVAYGGLKVELELMMPGARTHAVKHVITEGQG